MDILCLADASAANALQVQMLQEQVVPCTANSNFPARFVFDIVVAFGVI